MGPIRGRGLRSGPPPKGGAFQGRGEASERRSPWGQPRPAPPGPAFSLQDLLGLLLLFSLAAHVAEGQELGASPGAEAGASARPDELSVKRPGPCPPALGSRPPPPHPHRHCPASRCIKDLNRSHRAALLTAAAAAIRAGSPSTRLLFVTDRASLPDRVPFHILAPVTTKDPFSGSLPCAT